MGLQAQPVDYGWYKLQPKAGDFSSFDAYFAADKAPRTDSRRPKPGPIFTSAVRRFGAIDPAILTEKERAGTANGHVPIRDLKDYEAYLERVVPYIAKNYAYLPYRVYEMQWEPVIPWGWARHQSGFGGYVRGRASRRPQIRSQRARERPDAFFVWRYSAIRSVAEVGIGQIYRRFRLAYV